MDMVQLYCYVYNYLGTIPMETFLYHGDYYMFNLGAAGEHSLDDYLYYQVFNCD